jgi:hypothetical protein
MGSISAGVVILACKHNGNTNKQMFSPRMCSDTISK